MKPTMEALWKGDIAPGPNCGVYSRRLEQLSILSDRKLEQLKAALDPTQLQLLEAYQDTAAQHSLVLTEQAFQDGFCLASRLLCEAFTAD